MCLLALRSYTSVVTATVDPALSQLSRNRDTPDQNQPKYMKSVSSTQLLIQMSFFAVSANKANLLIFLCKKWCENEQLEPDLGPTHLYLGGGFKEETKSMVLTEGSVMDVSALESTQQEDTTRIILHILYSVQNEGVDRVVIHANDIDIIIMCLYYGATHLSDLPELWVRNVRVKLISTPKVSF